MTSEADALGPLLPPLRLVLLSACNGRCYFCHHEGYARTSPRRMSAELVTASAEAAQSLGIERISISGGEPTLLEDLPDVIKTVRSTFPRGTLALITNGHRLLSMLPHIAAELDKLDVSITSLKRNVYEKYGGVDPERVIAGLLAGKHSTMETGVNIPVVEENQAEVPRLIEKCAEWGVSVTLMLPFSFNLSTTKCEETIFSIIRQYGAFTLRFTSTPALVAQLAPGCCLKIKLPRVSRLVRWRSCVGCVRRTGCAECVCAIRIHPDGAVSACLRGEGREAGTSTDLADRMRRCLRALAGNISRWTDLLEPELLQVYRDGEGDVRACRGSPGSN